MDMIQLHSIGDEDLYDFLINAPKTFREGERMKKLQLKNGDYIHCVLWNYHFYITGTDIVKILIWRFQNAGRQIGAIKKFEEGIFSDLRNLKPGVDATLENPRSEFLEFLYKNGCIRTQKKQKVFFWYSVPHDALFCDAMERDLRRDTSIYTYNTYVSDSRKLSTPIDNTLRPSSMNFQAGQSYPKSTTDISQQYNNRIFPKAQASQVRDLFNIGDSLFGTPSTEKQNDAFRFIPTPKYNQTSSVASVGQMFGLKNVLLNGKGTNQAENSSKIESNMQRSRSALDPKYEFDEFDLEQLGFLKERCKEHFGFAKESCELKLFQNDKKEENIKGIDNRGEVRFVGGQNK